MKNKCRFRFTWLHLLIACGLILFGWCSQGCRDQYPLEPEPCDASRIEGKWQGQQSPYWHYTFDPPRLRQQIIIGGAVVVDQEYIYGTKADTLWASGTGGERIWRVCFPDDSTATYQEWNVWKWSPVRVLKRE